MCRELGVSEQTYYRWRNQYGGLKADDAKRLKELEKQNATRPQARTGRCGTGCVPGRRNAPVTGTDARITMRAPRAES